MVCKFIQYVHKYVPLSNTRIFISQFERMINELYTRYHLPF